MCEKDYIWNTATYGCENGEYVGNIIDNLLISCDQIMDTTKSISIKTVLTKNTSTGFYTV